MGLRQPGWLWAEGREVAQSEGISFQLQNQKVPTEYSLWTLGNGAASMLTFLRRNFSRAPWGPNQTVDHCAAAPPATEMPRDPNWPIRASHLRAKEVGWGSGCVLAYSCVDTAESNPLSTVVAVLGRREYGRWIQETSCLPYEEILLNEVKRN